MSNSERINQRSNSQPDTPGELKENKINRLREKLDNARRDLLDLGLRNTLLNYRPLKSRGVEISEGLSDEIYNTLVNEGQKVIFLPMQDEEVENREQVNMFPVSFQQIDIDHKKKKDELQTPYSAGELQKRLLNTYYAARTQIEEQGVNTLFLAIGMLEWTESENSEEPHLAPLILIPIQLNRESVRSPFSGTYTGEDIKENLSLREKLISDFRVELPRVGQEDELDVIGYFEKVEKSVIDFENWRLYRDRIALGFFSFAKFLMYKDLDWDMWPEEENLNDHPLLSKLLEKGFIEADYGISEETRLDDFISPMDLYNVVDADSSQTEAIFSVMHGLNLVIQGPPGTGKSQTITNLIAEAVRKGKKVLFVAEKMAALNVVKRMLDNIGLGDPCIELHSNKANKKVFLEELKRTLELTLPVEQDFLIEITSLINSRDRLNAYCEAVHRIIPNRDVTPYRVFGRKIKLDNELSRFNHFDFEVGSAIDLPWSEFQQMLQRVEELQDLLKRTGVPLEHPFWGSEIREYDPDKGQRIKSESLATIKTLKSIVLAGKKLSSEIGLQNPQNIVETILIVNHAKKILDAPELKNVKIKDRSWLDEKNVLEKGLLAGQLIARLKKSYGNIFIPAAWNEPVLELRKCLAQYRGKWWRFLSRSYWRFKDELAGLCIQTPPKGLKNQIKILDELLEFQRKKPLLDCIDELGRTLFSSEWTKDSRDWDSLLQIFRYLHELFLDVRTKGTPKELIYYLDHKHPRDRLKNFEISSSKAIEIHKSEVSKLIALVNLNEEVRFGKNRSFLDLSFDQQGQLLNVWV
ncbi:MAG: DUF4011 domain-containing protein, partial [Candidatus Hodarchaeales archaeon]